MLYYERALRPQIPRMRAFDSVDFGPSWQLSHLEAPEQMNHRPSPGALEVDHVMIAVVNWLLFLRTFRAGMTGLHLRSSAHLRCKENAPTPRNAFVRIKK